MHVSVLRERLRLSKLFIVPGLAVFGEADDGRPILEASPIEQALFPPAAFRDWSNARGEK